MMARYETQCRLLAQAAKELKTAREAPEAVEAAAAKLDAVSGKMQSLERNILQYAEKLGLTPSGPGAAGPEAGPGGRRGQGGPGR